MMYSREDLACRPVWYHPKTDSTYILMCVASCSTNGREADEDVVVYLSINKQTVHYRAVSEFLDGRFQPVPPESDEKT